MAAIISVFTGSPDKALAYIADARKSGIKVLPPNINTSVGDCIPEDGNIRMGLSIVKGVGEGLVQNIINYRNAHGPFVSFCDFLPACESLGANKGSVGALIKSGAFDLMPETRASMLASYEKVLISLKPDKNQIEGQISIFDFMGKEDGFEQVRIDPLPELDQDTLLKQEKETTGFYISAHPLDEYRYFFNKATTRKICALEEEEDSSRRGMPPVLTIGGIITSYQRMYTKKESKPMCKFKLEDDTGEILCLAFPKAYQMSNIGKLRIGEDSKVIVKGRYDSEDEEPKFVVDSILRFEDAKKNLNVTFDSAEEYKAAIPKFTKVLEKYRGEDIVTVTILHPSRMQKDVCRTFRVNEASLKKLRRMYGSKHLVIGA